MDQSAQGGFGGMYGDRPQHEASFSTGPQQRHPRQHRRQEESTPRSAGYVDSRVANSSDPNPPRQERDSVFFLNRLEEKLKSARKLPLSEQCVVDRMELLILLDNAKKSLPDDLRRAQWLLEQNHNLLAETRKAAEKIMREAEQEIAKMVDEHEITQAAEEEARILLEEASMQSRQVHEEAMLYANNILQDLEEQLTEMLVFVRKNKSQM